jgi:sugar lactone lactonase YvrE
VLYPIFELNAKIALGDGPVWDGEDPFAADVFENDNHSLRATAPEIPGTLVSIPEPSSALLGLLGVTALGLRRRRR